MRPAGPAPIMQTSCCSALDWCLESRGIMLTGAFSLMGSGRGVASSSLPLTRVSVSMSTSPSLLPPRGLEAPLDILGFSRGPHRTRDFVCIKVGDVTVGPFFSLVASASKRLRFMRGGGFFWWGTMMDGDGDGEMQMHPKHRRQDQIFACKHKLQPVIVSQWRPVESAESLSLSLCCPSTTPRCTSVWRIRFPCRKLPMTAGRAYGGS